ncbi:MAG: T9SS type A sorting domain-containing protein, partial [Bacteroidota bacterium]
SYQWKVNGTNAGTNSPTFTTSTLTNGNTVSCVMTSNASCASTPTATSNTLTMAVTTGVTPSISISSGSGTSVCSGTGVNFTSTALNPGSAPTYQWLVNGLPVGTNSPSYFSNSLNDGDVVSCQMTSNDPCATTTTVVSQAITMTVTSSISASITVNGATSFCQGGQVQLTATAGDAYLWSPGGSTAQTITATSSGTYFVTVWSGSCNATSTSVAISVFPNPTVIFATPSPLCSTDSATLLSGGQPTGGAYSGIGVFAGAFDPTVSGIGSFPLEYSVTSNDGCTSTATANMVVNDCSIQAACGAFAAYTQEQWGGSDPTATVPSYLQAHFSAAFPNGLSIGDCGRSLQLTSATAVTDFLASTGFARPLSPGTLVDPTSVSYSNSFAGELLALTLNVMFDSLDPNFSPSGVLLKDAFIARGPFSGWTVMQLYNEANHIIGCVGTNSYIKRLTKALEDVNGYENEEDDDDNEGDDGFLVCPGDPRLSGLFSGSANALQLNVFPNPTKDRIYLNYETMEPGSIVVEVFDVTGKKMVETNQESLRSGEFTVEIPLPSSDFLPGMYVVRLMNADRAAYARFVISE